MPVEPTLSAACHALNAAIATCPPATDLHSALLSMLAAHTAAARSPPDPIVHWQPTLKKVIDFAGDVHALLRARSEEDSEIHARVEEFKHDADALHAECDIRGLYTASVPPLASHRLCDRLLLCLESMPPDVPWEEGVLGPRGENLRVILTSLPVYYSFIEHLLTSDISMAQFSEKLTGFVRDTLRQPETQPQPSSSSVCPPLEVSRFFRIRDALNAYIDKVNNSPLTPENATVITTILQLLWPGVGDEPLSTEMEIMNSCITFDTKSSELNFPTMLGATENSVLFKATFEIPGDYSEDTRPTWPTAVAVKMFRPSTVTVTRELFFRQEALRVTTFSHPCLLAIHGFHWPREVSAENSNGSVMTNDIVVISELMTNSLRTASQMSPLATPQARLRVLADVARAMAYLHKAGVCYMGLTPDNVLLRIHDDVSYGHAKVDITSLFRYALFPEWMDSVPLRSWLYVPPEMFSGQISFFTSDTWSFGVLVCFLMGDATESEEKAYWKRASVTSQKRLARSWSGTIRDERVREFAITCLRENPEERPVAAVLVEKLDGILESLSAYGESNDEIIGGNHVDTETHDELLDSNTGSRLGPENKAYCEFEDVCLELSDRDKLSDDDSLFSVGKGPGTKRKGEGASSQGTKRRRVEKPSAEDPDWNMGNGKSKALRNESSSSGSPSPESRTERKKLPRRKAKQRGKEMHAVNSSAEVEPSLDVEAVGSSAALADRQRKTPEVIPLSNTVYKDAQGRKGDAMENYDEDGDVVQLTADGKRASPKVAAQHPECSNRSNDSNGVYQSGDDDLFDDDGALFIQPDPVQNGLQKSQATVSSPRGMGRFPSSNDTTSGTASESEKLNLRAESILESGRTGCLEQAASIFKAAADTGNANAQVNYGHCLEHGRGVKRDFCEAAMYFQLAANKGNPKGQLRIGLCHEFGRGTKKDFRVAVQWYKRASDQENTQAQTNLGIAYHQGHGIERDYSKAAELYRRAVEDGHTAAMLNLGVLYEHGLGVRKDMAAAFNLYRKAANGGNERAMLNLALCYERGHGTPRDEHRAAVMYIKSADAGNHQAQFRAGQCFENGEGVKRDMVKAGTYFQMAAERDNLNAMCSLGILFEQGRGVDRDHMKAFKLFNAASKHGHSPSTVRLAQCFEHGIGVKKSMHNAIICLKKACEQKNPKAMVSMGYKYEAGAGVKKSTRDAVKLYKESARLGCAEGELALGQCYYFGYGMERNMTEALRLYQKACRKNDPGACLELANLYRDGLEVEQDYAKAFQLYKRSAAAGNTQAQLNLGECYFYGRGTSQEYDKAVQQFKLAAAGKSEHSAEAYRWLGDCYSDGNGVERNMKTAVRYFQIGADGGSACAQLSLGCCYENGQGVEVNGTKAVHLYRKAEKGGNSTAMNNLGILYEKGKHVKRDYHKAFRQYTKAVEHGVIEAICNLADCYAEGHGTTKDVSKAFELYKEAAGHGHSGAQCELGACYYVGKGTEQDFDKAVALFRRASASEPEAIRQMGTAHYDGLGVKQDYAEALRLFARAAEDGNEDAYLNIGLCHEQGKGVKQDYEKAADFYRKATDSGNMTAMHYLGNLYFNGLGVKKNLEEAVKWYREGRNLEVGQTLQ